MKRFFASIVSIMLTIGVGTVVLSTPALALGEGGVTRGINDARGDGVPTNLTNGDSSLVKKIINIMLYFIGILAVVMLIFGGFRYVVSSGNKDAVTSAKNTILYAVIGLLVALFAYAIIQFVLNTVIGLGGNSTDV